MPREKKSVNIQVGQRIKARRTELHLNREELAQRTGYSSNLIQEVERGRSGLSSESLCAFSTALNVSADALLFGDSLRGLEFLQRKLDTVPPAKLDHVLKIIDEAIACAQDAPSTAE
jgi:transcriptional regulator with XRE-family HTH domain